MFGNMCVKILIFYALIVFGFVFIDLWFVLLNYV